MDMAILGRFALELNADATFQDAAARLSAMLRELLESGLDGNTLLGLTVHIRDDDEYTNLFSQSWLNDPADTFDPQASNTLWRCLAQEKHTALLDIGLEQLLVLDREEIRDASLDGAALSDATTERYRARAATHVIAWPLIEARDTLRGMACLELADPPAIGNTEQLIEPARRAADLMAVATPTLYSLARRQAGPMEADALQEPIPYLNAFAKQPETLLITGATGTGKSRLARRIHELSHFADGPFVTCSVIGLSPEMQLAHLFGWRKGAFTGASDANPGLIQAAAGGTLFIDEVDKLNLEAQAGLLNLLEEREYLPLGEHRPKKADNVRFLVAANRDLQAAVAEGIFRQDLYYRINVLPIRVPSLQEQMSTLPDWTAKLLESIASDLGQKSLEVDTAGMAQLRTHSWPGNLRELDSVLRRAAVLCLNDSAGVIGRDRIRQAMALDIPAGSQDVLSSLENAMRALLSLRDAEPAVFDTLRELVRSNLLFAVLWHQTTQTVSEDPRTAAAIIGKETSVESRNYRKELKREMGKLAQAFEALGRPIPEEVSRLID